MTAIPIIPARDLSGSDDPADVTASEVLGDIGGTVGVVTFDRDVVFENPVREGGWLEVVFVKIPTIVVVTCGVSDEAGAVPVTEMVTSGVELLETLA